MATLMDDLREIASLADDGNETAMAFMDWYLADSDEAEQSATFPADRSEQALLGDQIGHTVSLFLAARCARYAMDTGKAPDVFTFKVSFGFEDLS